MSDEPVSDPPPSPSIIPAGDPPSGDPPTPASFSFYAEDGNIHAGIAEHLGDDQKSVRAMFDKYKGADNPTAEFLKGVGNLQYHMGQKGFERPADDAPEDVKADFQSRIRALNKTPDSAEGYGFKRPEGLDESIPFDDAEAKAYSEILYKHGASPELGAELIELYGQGLAGVPAVVQAEEDAHRTAQIDILRNEHGVNAEKVIQSATDAGKLLGLSDDLVSHIAMSAEGINHLAQLKSIISGDLISAIKSNDGVSTGAGAGTYLEKAQEESRLAGIAAEKNDIPAMNKHLENQSRFNQLHANTQK